MIKIFLLVSVLSSLLNAASIQSEQCESKDIVLYRVNKLYIDMNEKCKSKGVYLQNANDTYRLDGDVLLHYDSLSLYREDSILFLTAAFTLDTKASRYLVTIFSTGWMQSTNAAKLHMVKNASMSSNFGEQAMYMDVLNTHRLYGHFAIWNRYERTISRMNGRDKGTCHQILEDGYRYSVENDRMTPFVKKHILKEECTYAMEY